MIPLSRHRTLCRVAELPDGMDTRLSLRRGQRCPRHSPSMTPIGELQGSPYLLGGRPRPPGAVRSMSGLASPSFSTTPTPTTCWEPQESGGGLHPAHLSGAPGRMAAGGKIALQDTACQVQRMLWPGFTRREQEEEWRPSLGAQTRG